MTSLFYISKLMISVGTKAIEFIYTTNMNSRAGVRLCSLLIFHL